MKQDETFYAVRRQYIPTGGPRRDYAGKMSWMCNHGKHASCAKLDCPCNCHTQDEEDATPRNGHKV